MKSGRAFSGAAWEFSARFRSDCQLQETGTCCLKMRLFETKFIQINSHVEARVALGLAEHGSGSAVGAVGRGRHNTCTSHPDSLDPCLTPLTSRCDSACFVFLLTSREALLPGWRWFDLWHELFALVMVWVVMEYGVASSIRI